MRTEAGKLKGFVEADRLLQAFLSLLVLIVSTVVVSTPKQALAWPTKLTSCTSCHSLSDPNAAINTFIAGAAATSVSVQAGGSFEVDYYFTNVTNAGANANGVGLQVAVPTGWAVAAGTSTYAPTGWKTAWNNAAGKGAWSTKYSTATEFPSSPDGYTIDFGGTLYDWDGTGGGKTHNSARDDGNINGGVMPSDQDSTAEMMGADAVITVPAGTAPGTYSVVVAGIGHEGTTKCNIARTLTITVTAAGGGDTTKPVVSAGFAATTPSLSSTIAVSGFAATDNTGVTGYMITTSATAPLSTDAGWLASAPTSYTVAADGSYTLYPWAKDAAGNVSAVYASPVAVVVDTVKPTVSSTVPVNGATGSTLNGAVTINFSEAVNCTTVSTSSVTISPAVTWTRTSCSGSQAVFTPAGQANSTAYTVTVGTAVAYSAGNTLAASYPFSYTTAAPAPNNAPGAPASLVQYKSDGTTVLTRGLYTNLTTLVFKGTVTDPDSDTVKLDIELADVGAAFTGSPTCSGTLVTSGTTAAATCSSIPNGRFKWQARATDSKGATGSWTQY